MTKRIYLVRTNSIYERNKCYSERVDKYLDELIKLNRKHNLQFDITKQNDVGIINLNSNPYSGIDENLCGKYFNFIIYEDIEHELIKEDGKGIKDAKEKKVEVVNES